MRISTDAIDHLLNRPKAYYNVDGVGELGIGVMCLGYSLLGWLQVHSPEHSIWNRTYTLFIFVGLMCALIHYGSKAIKTRVTYPRTGFVEYRKRDTAWRPMLAGAVASLLISVGIVATTRWRWDATALISGVGLLLAASYARGFTRNAGWKWTVVGVMVSGAMALPLLPAELIGRVAGDSWITRQFPAKAVGALWLIMMLYGILLVISGGITFGLYLHRTHAPVQEAE